MFTGIIKEIGEITSIHPFDGGQEMTISCELAQALNVDQSICINGVCHTVVNTKNSSFSVQTVDETLKKTNLESLNEGDRINLEPSLRADQAMDGHMVQGHVDTTGRIESIEQKEDDRIFSVTFPDEFKDLIVPRGSITLNGISLTVAQLNENSFRVAIIPHTYKHTTMKHVKQGDQINLEFDVLGKYVIRYLNQHE